MELWIKVILSVLYHPYIIFISSFGDSICHTPWANVKYAFQSLTRPGSSHLKKRCCDGLVVDGTTSFPFLSRSGPFLPSSSSFTDLNGKRYDWQRQFQFHSISISFHILQYSSSVPTLDDFLFMSFGKCFGISIMRKWNHEPLWHPGQLCGSISSVRSWEQRWVDDEWIISRVVALQCGSSDLRLLCIKGCLVLDTQISQVKMFTVKIGALSMEYHHCKGQTQDSVSSCLQSTSHD